MKKKFLISLILIGILLLVSIYISTQDNLRFKLDYEVYNYISFENGKKIVTKITSKNNIKYVEQEDLEKVLTTGTSIIYFGYSTCPWCRNIVAPLIDVTNENDFKNLYYVNVKEINTKEIMPILEEYLEEDDDGNKRLYVPDVYFIKDGKIITHHLGSVDSYKNAFLGMNKEQRQELKSIYQKGIDKLRGENEDEWKIKSSIYGNPWL